MNCVILGLTTALVLNCVILGLKESMCLLISAVLIIGTVELALIVYIPLELLKEYMWSTTMNLVLGL